MSLKNEKNAKFSERLAMAIKLAGTNEEKLAEKLNINKTSVSYWMHGAVPDDLKFTEIAHALNVSPIWLATGKGSKELPKNFKATTEMVLDIYMHQFREAAFRTIESLPQEIVFQYIEESTGSKMKYWWKIVVKTPKGEWRSARQPGQLLDYRPKVVYLFGKIPKEFTPILESYAADPDIEVQQVRK